jgi:hypothetical protein
MRPLFSPYQREATVSDESDGVFLGACNGGGREASTFPHLPQANHQSTQVSKTARPGAPGLARELSADDNAAMFVDRD